MVAQDSMDARDGEATGWGRCARGMQRPRVKGAKGVRGGAQMAADAQRNRSTRAAGPNE